MTARAVVRADAVFEGALGVTLVLGALSGTLDFPHPVGRVAVLVVGVLLLAVAAALWQLPVRMSVLVAANLATALAAIAWLAAATGFSSGGAALLGAAISGLVGLAAAELACSGYAARE
jgi:hypothetical protein